MLQSNLTGEIVGYTQLEPFRCKERVQVSIASREVDSQERHISVWLLDENNWKTNGVDRVKIGKLKVYKLRTCPVLVG
jgi:hypothetical protein